jgi:hypothetical protein
MSGKHGSLVADGSAAPIGAGVHALLANVTIETASIAPSTDGSRLVMRLDDQALSTMTELANSPLPALPRCDDDHFDKSLRAMSILPRRADDEVKGELRAHLYRRMIGHFPREAISFLAEQSLATLDWFPSPKQCLEILARWARNDEPVQRQAAAIRLVRAERQARFDDIMLALELRQLDQAAIDALPVKIRSIAAERGFLRLHDDGVYRARPVPCGTKGDSENGATVI